MRSNQATRNRPREVQLDLLPATAHPNLFKLWRLWEERGWIEDAPDRSMLDFDLMKPWLGHISIYQALEDGSDFHIKLDGTAIVDLSGQDWTRRSAAGVDDVFGSSLLTCMRTAMLLARPAIHGISVFQHDFLSATRLLLPVRPVPMCPPAQVFLVLYVDPAGGLAQGAPR